MARQPRQRFFAARSVAPHRPLHLLLGPAHRQDHPLEPLNTARFDQDSGLYHYDNRPDRPLRNSR